jgi:hypothetical protein
LPEEFRFMGFWGFGLFFRHPSTSFWQPRSSSTCVNAVRETVFRE